MRAGLVKVEVLNVTVIFSKSRGAAFDEKSWHTRRKLARSSDSMRLSTFSRQSSFSQKRKKTELVESTRLQMEPLDGIALVWLICECMVPTEACLHLPSALVTGLSGISPNSSLELDRDTVVAALPWLP